MTKCDMFDVMLATALFGKVVFVIGLQNKVKSCHTRCGRHNF